MEKPPTCRCANAYMFTVALNLDVSRTSKIEMSGRGDVVVDMYNQTLELTSIEMGYGLAEWKGVEIHGSRFELADVWHDLETFTIWVAHPSGIPTVYVKTGEQHHHRSDSPSNSLSG